MAEKKRIPLAKFVKSNSSFGALVSKLVDNREREKSFIDEAGSYNVMTQTASLKAISKDVQESSKNTESIISLFPDMELSMQILISSIISPKDMTGDQLIYKVNQSFLTPDITSQLIEIIKENVESYYKIREDLSDILRQILFISGAYSVAVIPESELDVIINSQANLTTESLIKNKIIDKNNEFGSLGFLGNPNNKSSNLAYESLNKNKSNYTEKSLYKTDDSNLKKIAENLTTDLMSAREFTVLEDEARKEVEKYVTSIHNKIIDSVKHIVVNDNPEELKMPKIMAHKVKQTTESILEKKYPTMHKLAHESKAIPGADETDIAKIKDSLYKIPQGKTSPFVSFSLLNPVRKNIGRPLILKLPSESLIPVHTPGDPNNHIGYFVLVDQHGSPLHMVERITALTELDEGLMQPDTSMNSILVQRAQDNIRGKNIKGMSIDNALPIYTNLVEQELMARLESGIYGKNVEISNVNEIYKIMLSRTLKNQMTKIIYMPVNMVEYMRYKIHQNGVGKALTEDLRILMSIRAMTLFSRLMGSVKNSIGITEINLKLDERDPDPLKTIEIVKNEILRARQQNFPIGISTPMDLADWVQRSGLEFTFEGHPRIPDVKLDYNQHGASNIMPDETLDEDLRKRTIMAYGLSPETVDNGFSPDFATTVVANNALLSKRVIVIQKTILAHLKSLVTKIVRADSVILDSIKSVIVKNLVEIKDLMKLGDKKINDETLIDLVIDEFLEIFSIELPLPETISITNQMDSFDKYQEFLDKALDAWVNTDMFSEPVAGSISEHMTTMKAVLKSYYTRKWITENGVMEELGEITESLADSNIFDIQQKFSSKIILEATKYVTGMQEMVKAANKDLNNYQVSTDGGSYDEGSTDGDEFGEIGEDEGIVADDTETNDATNDDNDAVNRDDAANQNSDTEQSEDNPSI